MEEYKHIVTFPVRYYECDAYNHVNHANYVRYMSEAAFQASAMVGYTDHKLRQSDVAWITREHEIEFLRPFEFGDTVTVHTWVADFRRVRSRRMYEFYNGDQLAARASTDWVFVNRITGQPQTVPQGMADNFMRLNGQPADAERPKRTKFPKPAPPPLNLYRHRAQVEWRDVDPQGHVNNAAYLSYIENGTWDLCGHYGWPPTRLAEENLGIIARRYRIEYLQPAVMGDELELTTWASDRKRATAFRHYAIHRVSDRAQLVRARAYWVWVNLQTGKPIRIPQHFIDDFAPNFSPIDA